MFFLVATYFVKHTGPCKNYQLKTLPSFLVAGILPFGFNVESLSMKLNTLILIFSLGQKLSSNKDDTGKD